MVSFKPPYPPGKTTRIQKQVRSLSVVGCRSQATLRQQHTGISGKKLITQNEQLAARALRIPCRKAGARRRFPCRIPASSSIDGTVCSAEWHSTRDPMIWKEEPYAEG